MTLKERVEELELRMGDLIFEYEMYVGEYYHWESVYDQLENSDTDSMYMHML